MAMLDWKSTFRYGVVGVLNSVLGYVIYLVITSIGVDPKLAVTIMYPIGAATAYFGHAKYAFQFQGSMGHGLLRYILAHLVGYSINVAMLYELSDRLGYPHQTVQAVAIVVVAGALYVLFRIFVFPNRTTRS